LIDEILDVTVSYGIGGYPDTAAFGCRHEAEKFNRVWSAFENRMSGDPLAKRQEIGERARGDFPAKVSGSEVDSSGRASIGAVLSLEGLEIAGLPYRHGPTEAGACGDRTTFGT